MIILITKIKDLCRCLQFKNLPRLCMSATQAVTAFACDANLQNALHQAGVLVHFLFYMFNYDFTLDEGGVERSGESNQQEIANSLARCCLGACARLAEGNNTVMRSLVALLTPYLSKKIGSDATEILKIMNSNSRNPYLIWDNATRAELRSYLESERESLLKKGECEDKDLGSLFKYSILEKELSIGDIYIR